MADVVTLKGAAEIAAYRELVAAGKPLDIPRGRHVGADRMCVYRLAKKGVFEVDEEAGTYWLRPGVKVDVRRPLLEHLREGPIRTVDWPKYADSAKSLHVRIWRLRDRGYRIKAKPDPEHGHVVGRARIVYELEGR